MRRGEDCHQFVEGRKILPCHGRLYDGLDSMIARDEAWIRASHCGLALCAILRLLAEAETPPNSPLIIGGGILEEVPHGFIGLGACGCVAESPECQCEVGLVGGHPIEQILRKCGIAVLLDCQTQLPSQPADIGGVEVICKSGEGLLCLLKRLVLIIREEWDETLRKAREIPMSSTWADWNKRSAHGDRSS